MRRARRPRRRRQWSEAPARSRRDRRRRVEDHQPVIGHGAGGVARAPHGTVRGHADQPQAVKASGTPTRNPDAARDPVRREVQPDARAEPQTAHQEHGHHRREVFRSEQAGQPQPAIAVSATVAAYWPTTTQASAARRSRSARPAAAAALAARGRRPVDAGDGATRKQQRPASRCRWRGRTRRRSRPRARTRRRSPRADDRSGPSDEESAATPSCAIASAAAFRTDMNDSSAVEDRIIPGHLMGAVDAGAGRLIASKRASMHQSATPTRPKPRIRGQALRGRRALLRSPCRAQRRPQPLRARPLGVLRLNPRLTACASSAVVLRLERLGASLDAQHHAIAGDDRAEPHSPCAGGIIVAASAPRTCPTRSATPSCSRSNGCRGQYEVIHDEIAGEEDVVTITKKLVSPSRGSGPTTINCT